jgi:hypothetical protein
MTGNRPPATSQDQRAADTEGQCADEQFQAAVGAGEGEPPDSVVVTAAGLAVLVNVQITFSPAAMAAGKVKVPDDPEPLATAEFPLSALTQLQAAVWLFSVPLAADSAIVYWVPARPMTGPATAA